MFMILIDRDYWYKEGKAGIEDALNQTPINKKLAKNVIIFLGDGMGFQTIMASRVYKGQQKGESGEEGFLGFESFPHLGVSKVNRFLSPKCSLFA